MTHGQLPSHGPALASMRRRAGRLEDYAELRTSERLSVVHAAERMRISERTAWRYEAALKQAADTAANE